MTHNYCGETKRLLVEDSPFKEVWLNEEDLKTYTNRFTEDRLKFISKQSSENSKKYWKKVSKKKKV